MACKPGRADRIGAGVWQMLLILSLLMLAQNVVAQQGTVRAELSASNITLDESVTLTITAIGVDGEPDLSALNRNFEIIGQSSSRQISTISGGSDGPVTTQVVTWTLDLMPRKSGVFTVPSVRVGGVSSQLLTLTVSEVPAGVSRDVFVEASVDSRRPWVQSQVLLTLRVFQAIEIVDGSLSDPAGDSLQVQRIGKDQHSTETRDGREYRVTERRFALFPQKSGKVTIEPVVLNVSVPAKAGASRGFFTPTRKLSRRTRPITLDVRPRPATGPGWWLPASALRMDGAWAEDVSQAVVGQPLTRTITLRAAGVMDTQLPDIGIPAVDGASLYAEEPARVMGMNQSGLVAEQTIKWAVIPQRAGELRLPEIRVEWFDVRSGKAELAVLPEERITVQAAPIAAGTVDDQTGSAGTAASSPPATIPGGRDADGAGQARDRESAAAVPPEQLAYLDEQGPRVGADGAELAATGNGDDNGEGGDALSAPAPAADSDRAQTNASDSLAVSAGTLFTGSRLWQDWLWKLTTLVLLLLWLGTLGLAWHWRRRFLAVAAGDAHDGNSQLAEPAVFRQRPARGLTAMAPLADVSACCKAGDLSGLRGALLAWANRQWSSHPPQTLTELAARLQDRQAEEAADSVQALDAALYGAATDAEVQSQRLQRIERLPTLLSQAAPGARALSARADTDGQPLAGERQRSGRGLSSLS